MKIVFTGGGTGGHVIPNLAIIAELKKAAPRTEVFYIGSRHSIEEKLTQEAGIKFFPVATGKLRRYFSWKNFSDASKIPLGVIQAVNLLRKLKPDIVFAKGGFVSVPTALAAGILKIPLVVHESDSTPGLATQIAAKFATVVCLSFQSSDRGSWIADRRSRSSKLKAISYKLTGNPIRPVGSAARGKKFLNFQNNKPILLIVGGSSGAAFLNHLVEQTLPDLLKKANVVWLTGGQVVKAFNRFNLRTYDFLSAEYLDVLAAADLIVSRAGANALFEIAAASKPSLLIPLPTLGSRGDQLDNAKFFAKAGASQVLPQENLTLKKFAQAVSELLKNKTRRQKMGAVGKKLAPKNAAKKIAQILLRTAKK